MFVGRRKKLETLSKQYDKNEFTFFSTYGRRRIGKIQLIDEFIRNKCLLALHKSFTTFFQKTDLFPVRENLHWAGMIFA